MIRQISFMAYYFHWSQEEILNMSHRERLNYLDEISRINRSLNKDNSNIFEL